jgi:hypothetical protein
MSLPRKELDKIHITKTKVFRDNDFDILELGEGEEGSKYN